jgi:hypothetical protein
MTGVRDTRNRTMHGWAVALVLFSLAPIPAALAWDGEGRGHRIVCELAFREVRDATRERIKRLMRTDPDFHRFSEACTWPDRRRKRPAEHYVNLPRHARGLDEADPCPRAGRCLLTAIEEDLAVLASPAASEAAKLAALKFLGHWVGDLHQPLHVGFADDRGGNVIETEGSCADGLHAAWDGCILKQTLGRDVSAVVARLQEITPAERAAWVASRPLDWANESFAITIHPATRYCVGGGGCVPLRGGQRDPGARRGGQGGGGGRSPCAGERAGGP